VSSVVGAELAVDVDAGGESVGAAGPPAEQPATSTTVSASRSATAGGERESTPEATAAGD
jgi:hypothetical protein